MATKKNSKVKPENTAEVIAEEAVRIEQTVEETMAEVEQPVVEKEVEVITETTVAIEELPELAKKVLKLYPDMPKLYVSKTGGVFPVNTNPSSRGSAILYKNPFYQKP